MWGRVKFKDFSRTFNAMYQQIQGLNTEENGLEISKIWLFQTNLSNSFVRYEHAKSIQQNVRFECQTISENIQKLKQEKFTDFQVLLHKFKDFQVLYEPS
jgi:hypothetical protein